jgi:hypothetical protein
MLITRLTGLDISNGGNGLTKLPALLALASFGLLWFALADAVMTSAASDAYLMRPVDLAGSLREGGRRFLPVLGALFLKYLLVGVILFVAVLLAGIVAGVLAVVGKGVATANPSLLAGVVAVVGMVVGLALILPVIARYFAVPSVTVLESLGPVTSMRRSRTLASGRYRHVLGVIVLVWLIYFIPVTGINLIVSSMSRHWLAQVVSSVLAVLVYPVVAVVYVTLYYDLRIRKEGYDIELMSMRLGEGGAAVAPLGA